MRQLLKWIIKLPSLLEFGLFYLKEVIMSNLKVALDVVTPNYYMKPAMIELNLKGMSDQQMMLAANLITMTPGTISLDICEKTQQLKVHSMYAEDPEAAVSELEATILRRVRNVF